jgi:hypothetical protein
VTDIPTSSQLPVTLRPIAPCEPFAASSKSSRNTLMLMQRCAATSGTESSTLPKARRLKHVHQLSGPSLRGPRRCGPQRRCGMDSRCGGLQRASCLRKHRVARSGSPWNIQAGIDMTRECSCRPLGCWTPTTYSPYGEKYRGMSTHLCR